MVVSMVPLESCLEVSNTGEHLSCDPAFPQVAIYPRHVYSNRMCKIVWVDLIIIGAATNSPMVCPLHKGK